MAITIREIDNIFGRADRDVGNENIFIVLEDGYYMATVIMDNHNPCEIIDSSKKFKLSEMEKLEIACAVYACRLKTVEDSLNSLKKQT